VASRHNRIVPSELAAASSKGPVCALDTAWSTNPKTLRRARLLELSGWAFYVAGRGGVLGDDARPETVAAAIGVISLDAVRTGWEGARKVGPAEVAACRLAECAQWGDEHLSDLPGLDTMVALAETVVGSADGFALPLFAAARAMPMPDGGSGARAAILIHLMREHRAGAQLLAIRACGLTPVQAIIAGPEGEEEALAFGWRPPFPARLPLVRRYTYAEAIADRIVGQAFAPLRPAEQTELITLLTVAAASFASV
jgi:helix-turn-helix protein